MWVRLFVPPFKYPKEAWIFLEEIPGNHRLVKDGEHWAIERLEVGDSQSDPQSELDELGTDFEPLHAWVYLNPQ